MIALKKKLTRLWTARLAWVCFLFLITGQVNGQTVSIRGKVTDASTGEAIPYATIAIKGTSTGTNSSFDGVYRLVLTRRQDSLTVSCIGYVQQSFPLSGLAEQSVNLRIKPSSHSLNEVIVTPNGAVNPAWRIMRQIILHKTKNTPASLHSYEYENYSRMELDASHLSEAFLKKKFIKKAISMADSLNVLRINDVPVLPLYLSETSSDCYY